MPTTNVYMQGSINQLGHQVLMQFLYSNGKWTSIARDARLCMPAAIEHKMTDDK